MIGVTAETVRPTVPESKVKWLGTIGDFDYAEHDGVEYCVDQGVVLDPGAYTRQKGEIFIGKVKVEMIDGSRFENHLHHRALPVRTGTYAALVAKEAESKARLEAKPKPRPLDALSGHTLLTRRGDGILTIAEPPDGILAAALSKRQTAIHLPGRKQRIGVQDIFDVLRAKGIELALTDAGTMYALGVRITSDARSLIEQAAPLLHAHLRGQPLRCEFRHPEELAPAAITLLVGGAAVCEQHLSDVGA